MNRRQPRTNPTDKDESEQLESLNASMRSKREGPQRIRRSIEANIEAKTRKKRSQQQPASASYKRGV